MSEQLKAHKEGTLYFCTLTVVDWIDLFTRKCYAEEMVESLRCCQASKGLELFAFVIMPSHVHFIGRVQEGQLSDVLRDMKSYTAKRILDLVTNGPTESRREWLLRSFQEAAAKTLQNTTFMVWQKTNRPIEIRDRAMFEQKLRYIHQNPVEQGYVSLPEHYRWSSAHSECLLRMFE